MKKENRNNQRKSNLKAYTKYAGLGFQIVAYILIGIAIGQWLDGYLQTEIPILTLVFSLIAIVGTLYHIIREMS